MSTHACAARIQRGFTLIEMIITIVIMGLLAAVGSSMISDTFSTARMVNASQAGAEEARYALERLAREIREVKYNRIDATSGNYSVGSTMAPGATNLVFTRVINGSDVTVTINKSGANLTLGYSSPAVTSTLSSQVAAFTLDFLKLDNTATALTSEVRFVVITLVVTDATSGQSIRQQTRVVLRNA